MSNIGYILAATTWILTIGFVVGNAPGLVEEATQGAINTSELESNYEGGNLEAQANATTTDSVVDQATGLVDTLANPAGSNPLLAIINIVILAGIIAWLVAEVWIG